MGVKDWLTESLRIRQRGPQEVRTDTEVSEVMNSAPMKELMDFIGDLKEGAKERREVEEEYKLMVRDSLIGSAVELITEDATQEDDRRKKVFWVVEKDEGAYKGMLSELNSALEEMDIEHKVWGYVWRVLVYGGVFLKTYYSEFSQKKQPNHIFLGHF